MTREEFATLVGSRPVILDGATGTNLQKAGMPVGVCPEQWILENPGVLIELQERYVEAGTDILFAPTFTASRIKLPPLRQAGSNWRSTDWRILWCR